MTLDEQMIFISKMYNKLFYKQNLQQSGFGVSPQDIYQDYRALLKTLANFNDDSYPSVAAGVDSDNPCGSSIKMNNTTVALGKSFNSSYTIGLHLKPMTVYIRNYQRYHEASPANFMKFLNLLLWALSTKTSVFSEHACQVMRFISEYNYAMSMEYHQVGVSKVRNSYSKYTEHSPFDDDNYYGDDEDDSYDAINQKLSKCASKLLTKPNVMIKPYYAQILTSIAQARLEPQTSNISPYYQVYTNIDSSDTVRKHIIDNADSISKLGPRTALQKVILARVHILTGNALMKKLVEGISYNGDFDKARGYGIAISKLTSKYAMYIYTPDHPWSIRRASGKYIKHAMHAKDALRKKYAKAVEAKRKADADLAKIQNKF